MFHKLFFFKNKLAETVGLELGSLGWEARALATTPLRLPIYCNERGCNQILISCPSPSKCEHISISARILNIHSTLFYFFVVFCFLKSSHWISFYYAFLHSFLKALLKLFTNSMFSYPFFLYIMAILNIFLFTISHFIIFELIIYVDYWP